MPNLPKTSLGRYQYTALDKLSACTLGAVPGSQRFYLGERLSTELQGTVQHSVMQNGEQLLAQQQRQAGTLHIHLLATDQQRSLLTLLDASRPQHLAYSPYGHRTPENGLLSLLGFNGERPDPMTGHYLLGNGYRAFNPVLMRFNSPDSWSPFGKGGVNAYASFGGNPVNSVDPDGHAPIRVTMTVLRASSRFKAGLKSRLASSTNALTDPAIQGAKPLTNADPRIMPSTISDLKARKNIQALDVRTVSNLHDLRLIKGETYKYVFTDQSELVIGSTTRKYFPHPVLKYFSSRHSRVIAAGDIAERQGILVISQTTGHYFKSANGRDTTAPVISYLKNLGAKAASLRYEHGNYEIPKNYTP